MPSAYEILTPGTIFAGYRIERTLGSGGTGTVYVAKHPRLPRLDALKVLSVQHSSDHEFRSRFIREAEFAARLEHPNIIGVHDRGIEGGRLWIAMQFVDGVDAAALIRDGARVPADRAVHIVGAAARGLDHAHRAGMVHRDVKPANILLEPIPGQPDRVTITDFGIARGTAASTALTRTGTVLATIAYAAPEQLTADTVDQRADVYGLGCTLYELLTGAKPFPRATAEAVIRAHLEERPPRPTAMVPALPGAIDAVIAKALSKDPDRRYPSCGALAEAAAAALGIETPQGRGRRPSRKGVVALVVTTLIAAVAAAGISIVELRGGAHEQPAAVSSSPAPAADSWGAHEYVVKAFPSLLPATQTASGFEGLRCTAVDGDMQPIGVNESRDSVNRLNCNGDRNPVSRIVVACGGEDTAADFGGSDGPPSVLDEHWQRPSGQGRLILREFTDVGGFTGQLLVRFDDGARKNCILNVIGGNSGRDLYDRWWSVVPL
ncbi:serine/threonine-protein kinase [Nocardia sp. CDC160]|uniref:serine/threonine-protein kinase n=1 Tax=Nocardia sp. CDC160 TaxID=3112166 RepID=UPI002DBA91CF|nr:serine/threonine-protein kinase [Nocardia sp. CDC160]MEC3917816.1 serine/threonine-protein kinase [Nocardia sp. CDC160]